VTACDFDHGTGIMERVDHFAAAFHLLQRTTSKESTQIIFLNPN